MVVEHLFRLVFVCYCFLVGLLLVMVPWSPGWAAMIRHLPASFTFLATPWARGAVAGFGLVHFVWALYDVVSFARIEKHGSRPETPGGH